MSTKTDVALPDEKASARKKGVVNLDFSKGKATKPNGNGSPFKKAKKENKRLKLFLFGDTGSGKTTLALQFPAPVVIDMEKGTELYGGAFNFDVLHCTNPDEAKEAVDWLSANKHPHKTLVIDPVTIYWESLQKKWSDILLKRNKKSAGFKFEFYEMQTKDWMTVKSEFKEFLRKLIDLDMNIIVTARQKVKYAEGEFMKAIGETFDGEKSLPYLFDTIVHLRGQNEKGKFMGTCIKDRSNHLTRNGEYEVSYKLFEKLFGKKTLTRTAKPVDYATEKQVKQLKEYLEKSGASEAEIARKLATFDADSVETLTEENAEIIINIFKGASSGAKKEG